MQYYRLNNVMKSVGALALLIALGLMLSVLSVSASPGPSPLAHAAAVDADPHVERLDAAAAYAHIVEQLAADQGRDPAEIDADLRRQERHLNYLETVRLSDGFVDFKGPIGDTSAVMVVEPGRGKEFADAPADIEIRVASRSREQREQDFRHVDNLARGVAGDALAAVTYDIFDNEFTIWVMPGAADEELAGHLRGTVAGLASRASALVVEAGEAELLHGGQRAHRFGNVRTTGFGVNGCCGVEGYITVGHGLQNAQIVTVKTFQTNAYDIQTGFYKDSAVLWGGGASKWVRINSTQEAAMTGTPQHIYLNQYLCHYGHLSSSSCGSIVQVNYVYVDAGITWYASRTTSQLCQKGDSGGPVYMIYSTGLRGHGMLQGKHPNLACLYTSIWDQMNGTMYVFKK